MAITWTFCEQSLHYQYKKQKDEYLLKEHIKILTSVTIQKKLKDVPQFESKNIMLDYFWMECKPSK